VTEEKSKYIIVGGSAAGMAAAHTIRLHDRQGSVTVLSEEPDTPYFPLWCPGKSVRKIWSCPAAVPIPAGIFS
jgi:thioredoxin reductase